MPLADRATNVLQRVLAEPRLQTGELVLIGHSLGGLLIKQLLRTAESIAHQHEDAANFIRRVRRVAFLATPHFGVGAATLADRLRIFIRPSAATACLVRNDSNLRDLNNWYRDWSAKQDLAHLILTESRPMRVAGLIVKPDSSDPGILDNYSTGGARQFSRPICIDANHIGICKPKERSSEVYALIRNFLTRPLRSEPSIDEVLKTQATQIIETLIAATRETNARLHHLYPRELIDAEVQKSVSIMRRSRFFIGFSVYEHALRLGERILGGELEAASDAMKSYGLAWCARFLAVGEGGARSEELLRRAKELGNGPEITIGEAFRLSAIGNVEEALSKLLSVDSTAARSASLLIMTHNRDAFAAIQWLSNAGITISHLDADGKFVLITKILELGRWDKALEYANELQEDDFSQAPVLLHTAAMTNLAQAIPVELRTSILQQVPFQASIFPLASNETALSYRRRAKGLFERSAIATRELGCIEVTNAAEEYALWLELRDPEDHDAGRQKLAISMRDPSHSLRRLYLALQFRLKLDLEAVENEIERQIALSGDKSGDAAFARFSLAFAQGSPKAVAEYIDRYRSQFAEHLSAKLVAGIEIEMLARAGLRQRAEERLLALVDVGLSEAEQAHLRTIITSFSGADSTEATETQFKSSGELSDLISLVNRLEEQTDWPRLCHYGSILFERTQSLLDAERLAKAQEASGRYDDLSALLRRYPEFLEQSDDLQMLWAWSLYREGSLLESAATLAKLRLKRDHPNDRSLTVYLAIGSGDWKALFSFVENEWANREKRDARELMRTAHLAHSSGSTRVKDFVHQAVNREPDNAFILAAAYDLATRSGWEDKETAQWLHRAAELSDEKGPVQRGSLKDLLDRAPDWNRREMETWEQLHEGTLPVFCAAHLLNQSLVDLFLLPALANPSEPDPRRRGLVPAYSGVRHPIQCDYHEVAFDPTTLLTLGALGLLEATSKLFDRVLVPHSTLVWLFEEKQRVSFHQPSRIRKASELRELLANGALKTFTPGAQMAADLVAEVGDELASLIAEASTGDSGDERQRIVVRPAPVHRIGSLMDEEADLTQYSSHLCSCSSIVNKLKERGQLTVSEENRARSYLSLHEREWPSQPEISDNAVLYLDDISVSYLQHTGLLAKLGSAGLEAYVSERTTKEVNSLLHYEQLTSRVSDVIESIRDLLSAGIRTGKIALAKMPPVDEADESSIRNHPTFALFNLATDVEAIIVDDRSLNKHQFFEGGAGRIPILTTLDLLDALYSSGNITADILLEYRTSLRRAGYLFVPVTKDEIERHLSAATVINARVRETAELRAIRENILRIRMSRFLQLPYEVTWLNEVVQTFTDLLKAQWRPEIDEATTRARSEWLLGFLDRRGWLHCLGESAALAAIQDWYGPQVMLLLSAASDISPDTKEKYLQWVDERVLTNIREENPDLYSWIVERSKEIIEHVTEMNVSKGLE